MAIEFEPQVGSWYADGDGTLFKVNAVDEQGGFVEVQYFDGTIAELELEGWSELDLSQEAPPEDWSGPFDQILRDDFGDTGEPSLRDEWSNPIDGVSWSD